MKKKDEWKDKVPSARKEKKSIDQMISEHLDRLRAIQASEGLGAQLDAQVYQALKPRREATMAATGISMVDQFLRGQLTTLSGSPNQGGSGVFRPGDKVRLLRNRGGSPQPGDIGVVKDVMTPDALTLEISGLPNYLVTITDIEPMGGTVNPNVKFKPGDIVEFVMQGQSGDMNQAPGKQVRIVGHQEGRGYILDFTVQDPSYNKSWTSNLDARYFKLVKGVDVPQKKKIEFDSVVIEDSKREQILEALEQINQQDLIFNQWGFGETIEKGKGVSLLFYGEPGTGKTLMAQAIADKLDSKLKVISTADIESSTPGEAERNIRKFFKEAKEASEKAILLFDECDSLIYSRSSVGAILGAQINELLSNLEKFDGLTIFTTNRLGTLDEAVNRRLALKLEFGMPSPELRVKIWKRMFPKKAPLDNDIDWEKLANVEVTGGFIKNAVLRAARMAATEKVKKKKITQQHLVKALTLEATSMAEFKKASHAHQNRTVGVLKPEQFRAATERTLDRSIGRDTHEN